MSPSLSILWLTIIYGTFATTAVTMSTSTSTSLSTTDVVSTGAGTALTTSLSTSSSTSPSTIWVVSAETSSTSVPTSTSNSPSSIWVIGTHDNTLARSTLTSTLTVTVHPMVPIEEPLVGATAVNVTSSKSQIQWRDSPGELTLVTSTKSIKHITTKSVTALNVDSIDSTAAVDTTNPTGSIQQPHPHRTGTRLATLVASTSTETRTILATTTTTSTPSSQLVPRDLQSDSTIGTMIEFITESGVSTGIVSPPPATSTATTTSVASPIMGSLSTKTLTVSQKIELFLESVPTTLARPNVTETSVSTVYIIPPTSISTQVVTKTSTSIQAFVFTKTVTSTADRVMVIVTASPSISNKQRMDDAAAAAVQPLSKRWELPKGPFTVTVPSGGSPVTVPNYPVPNSGPKNGAPVTVCSSDCSKHCSKHISEPHQCLRFAKDIPRWGYLESMKRGLLYESYACLVCLNLPAMMETPDHPEGGNSLRETQDLVNAIFHVSVKVNMPPQLAFAIAMQESQASVRPHSGDQGNSRGPFQVQIPGAVTCLGTPIGGCTTDQIYAMASLGICGQWSCAAPYQRPGIITYWQQYPTEIGWISRGYNSGSVYDQNDLTAVAFGTNSYSSDIANRMMGRVVGGFYSRTCCAKCDEGRRILEVKTCGPVDGLMSDFCGDDKYSFHGQIG